MSIAEKLTQIAENEQKVYDSGYSQAEYDWWANFTANGTRRGYDYAFSYSNFEYIRPPFKLVPTRDAGANNMFSNMPKLKKIEKAYVDFSQKATGTSQTTGYYYTFNNCTWLKEIEDIGFQAGGYGYHSTFRKCYRLETIAVIRVAPTDRYNSDTFIGCEALKNITIEGTIGQNSFNVQWSTKLTHDSLMSIINALADYSEDTSGTTWTVTLGPENIAKLTEEELDIIDTKGWVVA